MKFFDAHAHIQLAQFDADRAEVLARMQEKEVGALVVGTDLETSKTAVELAEKHDFLWAAVGLHPNHSSTSSEQATFEEFEGLAKNPKVLAIGECGLDYYRNEPTAATKNAQQERFIKHIELAIAANKPLIVHCRPTQGTTNAHEDMFDILSKIRGDATDFTAVMHFFTSTKDIAEKYLALGCYLSFSGPITFTEMYDEAVAAAPLDRMLSETDSPFAAPVPYRGRRNEPVYVEEVVKKIAEVKEMALEEVSRQIILNSQRIFGLSKAR